jgi:hypothetical protein
MHAISQEHKNETLTAYIAESRDREMNTLYEASICDDEDDTLLAETSGYDRENLIAEVLRKYPGIKIEDA